MTYIPPNPNGQTTSTNSAPVVLASDQSKVSTYDQNLYLLGRIVKSLEALSVVDSSQRQRFTLDSITAALTLSTVTTVGTVTTVSTLTTVTNPVPIGNVATIASMDREMYINIARQAYGTCIRAKLS